MVSVFSQSERAAQLAARYAAVADIEGGDMDLDGASDDDMEEGDTGPAVLIGEMGCSGCQDNEHAGSSTGTLDGQLML